MKKLEWGGRIFLICIATGIVMFYGTACSKEQKQAGSIDSQTAAICSTLPIGTNTGSTEEQSSKASSKNITEKDNQSELDMIKKKAGKLSDIDGLVLVKELDDTICIDLKYATKDNFTGKKIYPSDVCALQRETAIKLCAANTELKKKGLKLKIWDAYRPLYVQRIFWDIVKDDRFVANPEAGGSIHNHGCAVDVTIVNEKGKEIKMPTGFDDFSDKASGNIDELTEDIKKNVTELRVAMTNNGFNMIGTEWWHFEDDEYSKYPLSDVRLEEFQK